MKILAIETSCDDTGIAIINASEKADFKILSNIVSSQIEVHKKWGGVYPTLAKREHQRNLVPVLEQSLRKAGLIKKTQSSNLKTQNHNSKLKTLKEILEREEKLYKQLEKFLKTHQKPDVDIISVTIGPGLEPCLWVGINFAKALSYFWDIPVVPVNHIEAHILVNFLPKINSNSKRKTQNSKPQLKTQNLNKIYFPAVCLVVSGGHTQLILMEKIGKYKIIGETKDDAAGECLDKCAKILGLGYPGGPEIAKIASQFKFRRGPTSTKLPRPMFNTKDYDFSFSGLKTAVLYNFKNKIIEPRVVLYSKTKKNGEYIQKMCVEIQQVVIDVLIKKTIKAAKDYRAKSIILGGGVSANEELRKQFMSKVKGLARNASSIADANRQLSNVNFLVPPKNFCTDNAVMTAITGFFHQKEKIGRAALPMLKAEANLRIK